MTRVVTFVWGGVQVREESEIPVPSDKRLAEGMDKEEILNASLIWMNKRV